ncbi:PQQ-dependent sugar dehydrogenase [Piscinibacter sp.]|uniref:PQQ-dependent sugar dehydrogenase n=1 Tax=Piscinibacter sp. TaxID=1903157 RepID=UPI0039E37603
MSTRTRRVVLAAVVVALAAAAIWATPKLLRRLDNQGLRPATVAKGLQHPWALAFLPDGRMLVTERPGHMRIVSPDGELSAPLEGLPPVGVNGEGGLMDVALDPQFTTNGLIYWTFAEPAPGDATKLGTAVARGRLDGQRIVGAEVILRQQEKSDNGLHFGSRLAFAPDGALLVGFGDRGERHAAQGEASLLGKLVRIEPDSIRAAIWTIGHRNIQALAFRPGSDELWALEHGPQGGDELNLIRRGLNYGWPVVTHGTEYDTSAPIGEGTAKPGIEPPVAWWGPKSIAPSGMAFLTSARYPGWEGQLFVGCLRLRSLLRIRLDGDRVVEQQHLLTGLSERIRDVRQGPDGWLYVLTDSPDGRLLRVER